MGWVVSTVCRRFSCPARTMRVRTCTTATTRPSATTRRRTTPRVSVSWDATTLLVRVGRRLLGLRRSSFAARACPPQNPPLPTSSSAPRKRFPCVPALCGGTPVLTDASQCSRVCRDRRLPAVWEAGRLGGAPRMGSLECRGRSTCPQLGWSKLGWRWWCAAAASSIPPPPWH